MNKRAFTLAEVLITLGIIGVVASITIPSLMHDTSKEQTVQKIRKSFSTLTQAYRLSVIDNDSVENWDWGTQGNSASIRTSFDKYWGQYLNIAKYCNTYQECGYKSNSTKDLNGDSRQVVVDTNNMTTVLLQDGSMFKVFHDEGASTTYLYIDIDGPKGTSVYGKDIFQFQIHSVKGLLPRGFNSSGVYDKTNVNQACDGTGQYDGDFCAARIMLDDWKITETYPWR